MTSRRLALTQATGFAGSLLLPLKAQAQLGSRWEARTGKAKDIAIGANGAVWVIGADQHGETGYGIHHWDGRRWLSVDGIATSIAVAPNGLPWVLNANHQIFERV